MTKKGAKAIRKGARLDRAESEQDVVRKIGEDGWYTSLHQAASAEISAEKERHAPAAAGPEKKEKKCNQGRDRGARPSTEDSFALAMAPLMRNRQGYETVRPSTERNGYFDLTQVPSEQSTFTKMNDRYKATNDGPLDDLTGMTVRNALLRTPPRRANRINTMF